MKVYATYRNGDMTEGRGPMVLDKIFLNKEHACRYIDHQEGVMGRKRNWSQDAHGDWTVTELNVIENDLVEEAARKERIKQEALSKLTMEEKVILGFPV